MLQNAISSESATYTSLVILSDSLCVFRRFLDLQMLLKLPVELQKAKNSLLFPKCTS